MKVYSVETNLSKKEKKKQGTECCYTCIPALKRTLAAFTAMGTRLGFEFVTG
jgi:hypothetical protein